VTDLTIDSRPAQKSQLVVLSILARAPEFGCVKSRLARHIGAPQALRVHIELLRHNLKVAREADCDVELVAAGNLQHPLLVRLAAEHNIPLLGQSDGDIGARMLATAQRQQNEGRMSLIIGSDCAVMSTDYLNMAADRLRQGARIVFGPAEDGGYVLVGQNGAVPAAFERVSWGSEYVMQQTRKSLGAAGIQWEELETLWDIDTVADLRRWRKTSDECRHPSRASP